MSEREQRIRIAVVDDHEMFRAGVIATFCSRISTWSDRRPTWRGQWR